MRTATPLTLRPSAPVAPAAATISRALPAFAAPPRPCPGVLAAAWTPAVVLVAFAALALHRPQLLATHHQILCVIFALGVVVTLSTVAHQLGRPRYPLVRRRLMLIALGAGAGLVVPLILLVQPMATDPTLGLAAALALACVFPLACTYAARTPDLFALDLLLRRTLAYGIIVVGMGLAELTLLLVLDTGASQLTLVDPAHLALGNLVLLLLVPLLQERVAGTIKRHVSAPGYSRRQELARFSDALGGAQTVEGVRRALADTLHHTINPRHHQLYVEDQRGRLQPSGTLDAGTAAPELPRRIVDEMHGGQIAYRFRWDDGRNPDASAFWSALGIEVVVPICTGGTLHAMLTLGSKRHGAPYHAEDVAFLRAVAAQAALGLTNARACAQLRQMNTTLERTVDERTAAERSANAGLHSANAELARSLDDLRGAYAQLEQNHACLLRAERLATLGRLTAGIAHEVNTPLSAVQNALRVLRELGEEYAASVDDPTVLPADHRDIAGEIITTARAAADWADKAARYIRGTKAHGRTARDTVSEPFAISEVIDEARTLLIHRLRVVRCTLECREQHPGITVVGDRSAFSQVMINIISNALDAYEDARMTDVRVLVSISQSSHGTTVEVRDWAGGIPLQVLPRIFEELFTTKGAGRGTGLGLWISRTIIEKEFGGLLDVMSAPGDGSCFIASIPAVPMRTSDNSASVTCQDAA